MGRVMEAALVSPLLQRLPSSLQSFFWFSNTPALFLFRFWPVSPSACVEWGHVCGILLRVKQPKLRWVYLRLSTRAIFIPITSRELHHLGDIRVFEAFGRKKGFIGFEYWKSLSVGIILHPTCCIGWALNCGILVQVQEPNLRWICLRWLSRSSEIRVFEAFEKKKCILFWATFSCFSKENPLHWQL